MTIERSHGRARPTLPRRADLRAITPARAESDRDRDRDSLGRFQTGNKVSVARGVNRDVKRLFGKLVRTELSEGAADAVSAAYRLFRSIMATMPSNAAIVRTQVASACWHTALAGHWRTVALEAGLESAEGIAADERATAHDLRSERLLVSAIDLAQRLPKPAPPIPAWWGTGPATPVSTATQDADAGVQDGPGSDVEDEGGSDGLDEAIARLRAKCGGRCAADLDLDEDEDEGEP
jgi:hypothetical protein